MAGELYYPNITGTFDWDVLLQATLQPYYTKIQNLQNQEQTIDSKISALNELSSKLQDLYSFASSLNPDSWFSKKAVENSNPDAVDVKLLTNDVPDYIAQGKVDKIAQIEIDYFTREFKSLDEELNSDEPNKEYTLSLSYKTTDGKEINKDITLKGSDTLQDVIDKINNDPDIGPYIHAYAMFTGNGYRLALMETNVENSDVESEAGGPYEKKGVKEVLGDYYIMQGAQNSEIAIGDNKFQTPGYTFKDLFPGLEITVKKTGDFTIKVTTDYQGIAKSFVDLINKINEVIKKINDLTKVTVSGDKVSAPKISDYSIKALKDRLQQLVNPLLEDSTASKYNIIDYNSTDGTITVDEAELIKFLKENPKDKWQVLYDVAKNAKNLADLATNKAYVATLLQSYNSEKDSIEDKIDYYQNLIQEKQLFLRKYYGRVEDYIATLKNTQEKINQILIAQMAQSK